MSNGPGSSLPRASEFFSVSFFFLKIFYSTGNGIALFCFVVVFFFLGGGGEKFSTKDYLGGDLTFSGK